ncbi:MAG: hypothetical protein JKY00_06860 [Roseicyclus sp.]|nr:hypothetical protein [Roseicyclus sp.]
MEIDYLTAITENNHFISLVNNSSSVNKDIFIKLFKSSLAFIKTKDYIFDDGFVDPEFIQWQIDWILSADESLIEELESYIDKITSLITKHDGYWFKKEMADVFEGDHFFPENFAISSMVYCLKGLCVDESRSLYLATRFESFIYFTDLVNNSLFRAEQIIGKRNAGLEKSKELRQHKTPIVKIINELAQHLWKEIPTLSSVAVADGINEKLSIILNAYREEKCTALDESGIYDKSRISDEETLPVKLKSSDAIRKQIAPLRPSVKRANNMKQFTNQIKKLLTNKLACSNEQCLCQK